MDKEIVSVLRQRLKKSRERYEPLVERAEKLAEEFQGLLREVTGVKTLKVELLIHTQLRPVFPKVKIEGGSMTSSRESTHDPAWVFGDVSPYSVYMDLPPGPLPFPLPPLPALPEPSESPAKASDNMAEDILNSLRARQVPTHNESVLCATMTVVLFQGQVRITLVTIPDLSRLTPEICEEIRDKLTTDDQIATELMFAAANGFGHTGKGDAQTEMMKQALELMRRQRKDSDGDASWRKSLDDDADDSDDIEDEEF